MTAARDMQLLLLDKYGRDLIAARAERDQALKREGEATRERDELRQEVGGGDIYRHERDDLRHQLDEARADAREARERAIEECAVAAGMAANELLERHNAARKAGAAVETLHALSERWAAAGDVAARIRALAPVPTAEAAKEPTT